MIWLDSLWTGVGEAGVFALASFGILSIAVICDYLRQKKLSYKFTRRFLPAKTGGEKPDKLFDSYKFEPDARYECIINFLILSSPSLDIFLNKKNQKKEIHRECNGSFENGCRFEIMSTFSHQFLLRIFHLLGLDRSFVGFNCIAH